MIILRTMNQLKYCVDCQTEKSLDEFYSAGKNFKQKLCKPCHNKTRKNYKLNYEKRLTKFVALPLDVQKFIFENISVMTLIDICRKVNENDHKKCKKLKPRTLSIWKKAGLVILI